MRLAFPSFFKAVSDTTIVSAEVKERASFGFATTPMVVIAKDDLRRVNGGDDEQLPKGGWKSIAASIA